MPTRSTGPAFSRGAMSGSRRSFSHMSSITEALAGLDAAVATVGAIDRDGLPVTELLESLDRLETARRHATACACDAAAAVDRRDERALGGRSHRVIADVLRISPADAKRRINDATQLCPRTERLLPEDRDDGVR